MNIKVSFERLLFEFVLWYEVLSLSLAIFMPKLENKLFVLLILFLYIYYTLFIAIKDVKKLFVSNVTLLIFVCYNMINSGVTSIIHLDFYAYIGMAYLFLVFTDQRVIKHLRYYIDIHAQRIIIMGIVYFGIILLSILVFDGLDRGYGVSIPILYGPYSVPHVLGYSMLFMYCVFAEVYRIKKRIVLLVLKSLCTVCALWTVARSVTLAILFLIFMDYCSMKKVSHKLLLAISGFLILLFLGLFTEVLIDNPVIQKTASAVADSGSYTNGRGRFAKIVINDYKNNSVWYEFFLGKGIDGVRHSLEKDPTVNKAIHAHNDYINVLCGYGGLGLIVLLYLQRRLLEVGNRKDLSFLGECFLFVLICTNGLAMYTLATPLTGYFVLFSQGQNCRMEAS